METKEEGALKEIENRTIKTGLKEKEKVTEELNRKDKIVILVGSTGHGKSTLGSFLIDNVNYENKPFFMRANTNYSCTDSVSVGYLMTHDYNYCIIDTPGLNENSEADIVHMIEIMKIIKSHGSISAVLV